MQTQADSEAAAAAATPRYLQLIVFIHVFLLVANVQCWHCVFSSQSANRAQCQLCVERRARSAN